MFRRRLSSFSVPFLVALMLVAAAGATTLTVIVSPKTVGTPKTPEPQAVSLSLTQIGYANGRPSQTLTAVTEQMPMTFRDALTLGPSCPASDFSDVGNNPPPCPSGSEVGTTNFAAYVPAINLNTTAAGYIYKISATQVDAWVHITKPTSISVALVGKVTPGTSTAGASVAWNLSAAVDFGVTADITAFATAFNPHTVTVTTTKTITVRTKATKTKKATVKKKKVKVSKAENVSTFESRGCPAAGSWNYSATLTYKSGSPETVSYALPCSAAAPTTVTVTVTNPGTCLGPICVEGTTLQADNTPAGTRVKR